MRIRHRIPSIFNLSMVDVLCCALGCVILLWLLNLREARQHTDQAGVVQKELDAARAELVALGQQMAALKTRLDDAKQQADAAFALSQASAAEMTSTEAALRDALVARDDLKERLTASAKRVASLETQVRDKEALAGIHARRAEEIGRQLADAESRNRELRPLADLVPGLREEANTVRDKLHAEEALAQALEKEVRKRVQQVTDSTRDFQSLQAQKEALLRDLETRDKELAAARLYRDKFTAAEIRSGVLEKELGERKKELVAVSRARAAAENRFAGLALTGRRVVFLVDMSGSMDLIDENTIAPGKWQGVRDTVAAIMRSLPDLEQFQVIVFAEKPSFLLGQDNRWIDYDVKTSPDRVKQALAQLKPHGGTNMYSPLESAFRLRSSGLDTVYLFSDGLPNMGEGLPETARNLSESQQGEILGRYIRKMLKTTWNRDIASQPHVRINAIGFFFESPDVGAFLWSLTRENDGGFVGMSKP